MEANANSATSRSARSLEEHARWAFEKIGRHDLSDAEEIWAADAVDHFLPVGDAAPDGYERHIGTPPGLDLGGIARACGAEHAAAETIEALTELIGTDHDGVVVAEVQSDRAANVALHRRVAESVITALGA